MVNHLDIKLGEMSEDLEVKDKDDDGEQAKKKVSNRKVFFFSILLLFKHFCCE